MKNGEMIYNIILPFVFIKLMFTVNVVKNSDIIKSFSPNMAHLVFYSNNL